METKVAIARLTNYNNAIHIEFHKTGYNIFDEFKEILNAPALMANYKACIKQEDEIYKWMRSSEYTEKKREVDNARDHTLKSIIKALQAYENHFDADMREAAKHVLRLINNYHKLTHTEYDGETAGIDSIIEHLALPEYSGDVTKLNMQQWFSELERLNALFKEYAADVELEQRNKPGISTKDARLQTDEVLKKLTARLTAVITIDGPEEAQPLLVAYNVHAAHYKTLWKEHYGRTHVKTDITGGTVKMAHEYAFTGKRINALPDSVTVEKTREGKTTTVELEFTEDYTVSYENNINRGTATLFIDGAGKFTGRITVSFDIV